MNPEDNRAKKNISQQLSANGRSQNPTKNKARQKALEDQSRKAGIKLSEAQQRKVQKERGVKDAEFYNKRRQDLESRKKAEKEQSSSKSRFDPMRVKRQEKFQQQSQGVAKTQEKKRERER